ncbi:MAG: Arm DNA-binding domain-containing protein, partial [Lachnospira sp.]|nr:Arm DNA-binding domain-containing protein [Lachnospira sp.]
MAVYKDKKRGTWYASVMYKDWTGKQCRKLKRGFATKK